MEPLVLVGYTLASLVIAWAGRKYRFGFWGYFFACLLLTPMIGAIIVIASVPVREEEHDEQG
ncbi:MAG: hypothetical protein LBU43_06025 [Candidatus Accumulibacter sp.]|jgi:ABC-type glycerol-3-phosphate transport system permease component|nr:hypothetical protein [Accumulibacter sp.]